MLVKAATGSLKNIVPKPLSARSNDASSNGWTWASPCSNATLVMPSEVASVRARSIIRAERSMPDTVPAGARAAASRASLPVPHPTSRTRLSGAMSAAASSLARWRRVAVS